MRYDDDGSPFDTGNRAWTRFETLLAEHFTVMAWTRPDGRPVLATLVDLPSGDCITLAILDSLEIREPHALVTITEDGAVALHGPFDGPHSASQHAAHLALRVDTLAATRAIALHDPIQPDIPAACWVDIPPRYADRAAPHPGTASATGLVLLDRRRRRFAAVGTFPNPASAAAWEPDPGLESGIDRLLVPLYPAEPQPPDQKDTPPPAQRLSTMDEQWLDGPHESILETLVQHLLTAGDLAWLCDAAGAPALVTADGVPVRVTSAATYRDRGALTLNRDVLVDLSDGSRFGLTATVSLRHDRDATLRPAD